MVLLNQVGPGVGLAAPWSVPSCVEKDENEVRRSGD